MIENFQVLLSIRYSNGYGTCNGALISPSFVLTAAHCLVDNTGRYQATGVFVIGGDFDFRIPSRFSQTSFSAYHIIHPTYDAPAHPNFTPRYNDIAIVKLRNRFTVKGHPTTGIACLPPFYRQPLTGANLVVSGWGVTDPSKSFHFY